MDKQYKRKRCDNDDTNDNKNNGHINKKNKNNKNEIDINNNDDVRDLDPICEDNCVDNLTLLFGPITDIPTEKNKNNMQDNKKSDISDVCKNPLCDHKTYEENPQQINIPNINTIEHVDHLIELGKSYHCKKNREYRGINLRILCNLVPSLTELTRMIGMDNVKERMVDQILFFLQGYHNNTKCNKCIDCAYNLPCPKNQTDMLHTVVSGPPGVGKTETGKILGKVYKEMGILTNNKFKVVGRSDLIAGYLGQTALKTQKVIDECKGGVLFIDEAYALGHEELRDSFSKECIDTLNQNLSERRDFLCIIAGYKDALEKCFFNFNDGLRRRFTFRYDLVPYKPQELKQIFELKVMLGGFKLCYTGADDDTIDKAKEKLVENTIVENLFVKNHRYFPNNGGDMETLFLNCKIAHSRSMVGNTNDKYILNVKDIEKGFDTFVKGRDYKNLELKCNDPPFGMYV